MIRHVTRLTANIFRAIWKLWGLAVVYIPVIMLSPLLMILIASGRLKAFWKIERLWARWILAALGFKPVKSRESASFDKHRQYIVVANHTSMVDIPFLLAVLPFPLTFVGKKELEKYPVFGYFYRKTNVLVDRASLASRKKVYDEVEDFIRKGFSIAIFAEGGVPDPSVLLAPFKNGAFRIAVEHGLPLLPVVLYDNKKRLPYALWKGSPGKMRYKILPPVETKGLTQDDTEDLKNYVYTLIYNALAADSLKNLAAKI